MRIKLLVLIFFTVSFLVLPQVCLGNTTIEEFISDFYRSCAQAKTGTNITVHKDQIKDTVIRYDEYNKGYVNIYLKPSNIGGNKVDVEFWACAISQDNVQKIKNSLSQTKIVFSVKSCRQKKSEMHVEIKLRLAITD